MDDLKKPIIQHIPGKIDGDFGVPPFHPFYCKYCDIRFKTVLEYNTHMAKHHPGEIKVPSEPAGGVKNPRDLLPYEEQQVIDEYIEYADYINNKLDEIDKECDKQLKDLSIPIDKDKDRLLYDAINCPYCGRKAAGDKLTAEDFAVKRKSLNNRNKVLFSHADPDKVGYKTPDDIRKEQQDKFDDMVKTMMRGVWNQILIWVLSFIYVQLRPLSGVKFVNKIPQKIKSAIDSLKSGGDLPLKKQLKKIQDTAAVDSGEDSEAQMDVAQDKAYADINPVSSIGQITQEISLFNCIQHEKDFFEKANEKVREQSPKHTAWFAIKQANEAQIQNIKTMQEVASLYVPDGFETPGGIKFEPNLPEEYLKARADGSTKFSSQWNGMKSVLDTINNDFIKSVEDGMKSWVMSPTFLCCVLRIITQIANLGKQVAHIGEHGERIALGKKNLLMIKGLLEFTLNIMTLDLNKSVVDFANFVITLVNSLIRKVFSSLGQLINSGINKYALNSKDLTRYKAFGRECLPWLELTTTLGLYLDRFMKEFGAYIASLFANGRLSALKAKKITDDAVFVLKFESWIRMIDNVLGFMKFWELCVENVEPGIDDLKSENVRLAAAAAADIDDRYMSNLLKDIVKKDKKFTTIYTGKSVTGIDSDKKDLKRKLSAEEEQVLKETEDYFKHADPWSIDGVKILLTNFMGYSQQEVGRILDGDGDCNCDKVLSDGELQEIQKILEGTAKL